MLRGTFIQILTFSTSLLSSYESVRTDGHGHTDGVTDRRTGKTRNAAYRTAA